MRELIKSPFVLVISLLLAGLITVFSNSAFAQTSAGQLLQQNKELEPAPSILPEAVPNPTLKEVGPSTPKPGQFTFVVKEFVFTGNTKISSQELQKVLIEFVGKSVTFDDLSLAADAVAEYYRQQGWLARAVLPKQDITEGKVTIQIIEAKLGGIKIENKSKRVSDQRVEEWIYGRIPKDADISLAELDHALLTLNDLPDVMVTSTLQGGVKPGETTLVLLVEDKPTFNGQVSIDNYGDRNTGIFRGSVMANANGLFGIGDQLSFYGLTSAGNNYGRLSFSAPVGVSGLRMGVNASTMAYRVLNQSFQSLNANGVANTGGVEASYPIIRSRPANLMSVFNWNYNEFKNWTIAGLNQDQSYSSSVAQFGLTGNLLDGIGGGALNNGSIMLSVGDMGRDSGGTYNQNYNVAGGFTKARYSFNRNQAITESLSGYISVSGQVASKNMDSSEQLYLGGPMSVRAYGSGQGAATQGNLTTIELRQNLPYQTQLSAFYDLGNVQTWKFNNTAINGVANNYALQGAGLSFSWIGPYNFNFRATWAQRTGPLPASVATYLTQNGGLSPNRFWLTATVPF